MTGGSSFEFHVQHAAAAIREGYCDTVLITYGSDQLSRMGRTLGTGGFAREGQRVPGPIQFEAPYGNSLVGAYAMAAQRHMHEFGTTSEQLAEIAVGVREFAALNPNAMYRDPITVDDVVELADDRRPAAQARLLRDLRRRRRVHPDHRRAGARPAPAAGVRARRGRRADALEHQPDARLHDVGRGRQRGGGVRAGRRRRPTTSTRSSSTTASPSPCWCCSRASASASRARAGRSSPRATCGGAASCRSTPTAAGCRRATRACAASSCSSRRRGSCAARAARRRCPTAQLALACGSGGWLSCIGAVILGKEAPA